MLPFGDLEPWITRGGGAFDFGHPAKGRLAPMSRIVEAELPLDGPLTIILEQLAYCF